MHAHPLRREGPRVDVEALCWEVVDGHEHTALAVELSAEGVRLERPYVAGPPRREIPLEIEVPGIDEILWAKGEACFDTLTWQRSLGLIRRTGYRIVSAAARDLRLLREYVFETHRARRADDIELKLATASCYFKA